MTVRLTNLQIAKAFEALENIGKLNIEFSDPLVVHDLALNKKALEPHYEAIKIIDTPSGEFKEYQRKAQSARNEHADNHAILRSTIIDLNVRYSKAIEREAERIDNLPDSRKKQIDIQNVRLLKRLTSDKKPVINGSSSAVAQFIMDIDPLFESEQYVTVKPEAKQKK